MSLDIVYQEIKKSIAAFVPSFMPPDVSGNMTGKRWRFPPVLGTGFVIREDGIVATNRHVVESFSDVWRPESLKDDEWGIDAMFLYPHEKGMIDIRIPVTGVINIKTLAGKYGPAAPDLSLVKILADDLVPMKLPENRPFREGVEVAAAGYPLGRRALDGPMGLHQVTPTLQKGIISAVLPYPSDRPHSFSVNIMSNSGASGSPVFFTDTGEIAGALFSVLNDVGYTRSNDEYLVPTAISYAVPFHYIKTALEKTGKQKFPENREIISIKKTVCESSPGMVYSDGICFHDFSEP